MLGLGTETAIQRLRVRYSNHFVIAIPTCVNLRNEFFPWTLRLSSPFGWLLTNYMVILQNIGFHFMESVVITDGM